MPSGGRAGFELVLLFCFITDDKINWNLAKGVRGATAKPPETGRETSFGSNLALSVSQAFILVLRSKLSYKSKQSSRPYLGALRSPPNPFAAAHNNCALLHLLHIRYVENANGQTGQAVLT